MSTAPGSNRSTKVVVVTAGLSQPSSTRLLAGRLAAATVRALDASSALGAAPEVEFVELRDLARELTNNLLTGFPSPELADVLGRVATADALIAVTPIFSASYSGLFKTFFDVLDPDALVGKPTLIAATGGSARHSLALEHALRPLFSYLRATVVPTAVYAASEDWASEGELNVRITRATSELARLVRPASPVATTQSAEPDDAEGDVIPFTRLLAAQRAAAVQQQR